MSYCICNMCSDYCLDFKIMHFYLCINLIPKGIINCMYKTQHSKFITTIIQLQKMLLFSFFNIFTQTKQFNDLVSSDYPNIQNRMKLFYNFITPMYRYRYLLVLIVTMLILPTITTLFINAIWFEREVWDLFGIFFLNNVELRRILNDYGFDGHPLKKDFPLSGFFEVFYSTMLGITMYKTIQLVQEFRFFYVNSPWNFNIYS